MISRPELIGPDAPRVMTTSSLTVLLSGPEGMPTRNRVFRWIHTKEAEGILFRVARGVYLNRLAWPPPQPQEAAGFIRRGAVVSLQKVLGDAGVLNNYTPVVTCIVPWEGRVFPKVGRVKAVGAEFWFHAQPYEIYAAGSLEDSRDSNVTYPRATPERALLDWLRLASAPGPHMAGPPLDVELDLMNTRRLNRLAKAMGLVEVLKDYRSRVGSYWSAPDVQANAAV